MARSFEQILAEVSSKSDPQRKIVLNQIADIPRQGQAEEQGLQAKLSQANEDILSGARRRGLGFSGIPIGEQADFAATEFAPALSRLRTSANDRRTALQGTLAETGRNDFSLARNIFESDRSFDENQRRFEIQQAAAARSASQANQIPSFLQALGLGGPQVQGDDIGVDDEEARFQEFQEQERRRQAALRRRVGATRGLRLQGSGNGLSVRGGGAIPSSVNTGRIPIR